MKKHLVLLGAALAFIAAPAAAQNTVPQVGVISNYASKTTYSAGFFGLVPVQTAATDQVCISGSATKTIKIQRIVINGVTITNPQSVPLNLVRRVSLDTGGTAASTTANPANTVAKRDVSVGVPTAVVVSYTAAPTITDAAPTYIETQMLTMPLVAGATSATPAVFEYAPDAASLVAAPTLVGAASQICVSNGAALTTASVWNGTIVWTEE